MRPAFWTVVLAAVILLASCGAAERTDGITGIPENMAVPQEETVINGAEGSMNRFDFSVFPNVSITGIDISSLKEAELDLLYAQAKYCQAMTDADIETMRELVSEDMIFIHMSGKKQTRDEYFADIASGALSYYTIGIADPVIKTDGNKGSITYTSVLNANAYGARGTYRIKGTHYYELLDGS